VCRKTVFVGSVKGVLEGVVGEPEVGRKRQICIGTIAGICRNPRILFSTRTGESGPPGSSKAFR